MPEIEDFLKGFPPETRERLRTVWEALPLDVQKELRRLPLRLPANPARWRLLSKLATAHFRMALGKQRSIAIVGPANVGKSTLYNQFIQRPADRAEVSPVPGTTRESRAGEAGLFAVVDTPGAQATGEAGREQEERAFAAAGQADFLVVMFDLAQGIRRADQELFRRLARLGKPYVVALNKLDLVRGSSQKAIETAAASLRLSPEHVLGISAKRGKDVERVLLAIAKAEPRILTALGQALPEFRSKLAWSAITGAASTSAAIALTPLPILDFFPLIAVQSSLVLSIARIYEFQVTPARAKELAATFGLGYLGRTLFQELSKLGGPPGWLLSSAIAASTTAAMGYAAIAWFERGERLSRQSLRKLTSALTSMLMDSLKSLGRRRPSREKLQKQVEQALAVVPAK